MGLLSRGLHAAVDVAIASTAGAVAVVICYPINILAAAVKIPLRLVKRSYDDFVGFSADYPVTDLKQDRAPHKG
jgi:hypothetical protein